MITTDLIKEAHQAIAGHVLRTPTLSTDAFGRPLEIKLEHMQHTGSFKARGAMWSILSSNIPDAGLVAASGGNHGAAVAWAASQKGIKAKIFVPEIAGPSKIALIKSLGADLVVVPGAYNEALSAAKDHETATGAAQIHAYDAPATLTGQATVMAEWEDQGLGADTILIAVGGGGLIGGAMAQQSGRRKIVAVEPQNAPTLNTALKNGAPTNVDVSGVAANALGAKKVGQLCFDLAVKQNVTSVVVDDAAILQAQKMIWDKTRQLVEPAGATALAAVLSGAYSAAKDEKLAVLFCGANIAPDPFVEMS